MKYWIDTEYFDDGKTVELVSLGIVAEDGREFYAVAAEFDRTKADSFLRANVLPLIPEDDPRLLPRAEIRQQLLAFIGADVPEFWSVCAAWDWFLLVRLFGSLNDLPESWPLYCGDLWQWAKQLGDPALPKHAGTEHQALADAKWHREVYQLLESIASKRTQWST